jgi:hypothetical protein
LSARAAVQDSEFQLIQSACVASVDSVLNEGGLDFSQQSKENFLYSAAPANSTMDYSTKVMEDSVVDSPPSRGPIPNAVTSPSPLKGKTRSRAQILNLGTDLRSIRKLYHPPTSSIQETLVKVPSIFLL